MSFVVDDSRVVLFQQKIWDRYSDHKRDLPRRKTHDPYHVLVSEIMLHQTQVSRVISYFHRFLDQFPDLSALAAGSKHDLLRCWSGLGYNNRVLRLQQAARIIVDKYGSVFPRTPQQLMSLPGIGIYTANAILAFAFNEDVPVIDVNIKRVLVYEFNCDLSITQKDLFNLALICLPQGRSRDWHNALMDYGSLVLTARFTGLRFQSKQSPFFGSSRRVRSSILKILLHQGAARLSDLQQQFFHDQFMSIIDTMKKENLIEVNGDFVILSRS